MIMEYVENIVQLVCLLAALLMSLFRYVSSRKRCWLYAVGFYTSSLLSCYFWTAYFVVMGDTPNASDLLTYFGWNVSYMVMLMLMLHAGAKEARRYFHILMLLPLPLNIWQLMLYLKFGGAVNSTYQVTVCTLISVFSIRDILWYLKNRKKGAKKPYTAAALLLCVCAEMGMWTASCFDGWAQNVYYGCSILCSLSYLLIVWAVKKSFGYEPSESDKLIDRNMQRILKGGYLAVVLVCCLGGIVLGCWIRDTLTSVMPEEAETDVYAIIHIILFIISIILAAFAIAVIMIVYFEQKMSENNRLREEKKVAEQSNAAKSDFLANMSHEIRTPINAVLGMNKMIMRESVRARDLLPRDREEIRRVFSEITDCSGNIDSAGNNLLSIINDILDFSKIEAGRLDLAEREYMLSSVLNDVSNTIIFKAKEKGLEFSVETDSGLPDGLFGDDVRIRQIMINLLNNAVKYTDRGSVTLSVSGSAGDTPEQIGLVIAVKDTGTGIKKDDIGRIFGKFERTDMERNSSVEGTGLGLAITHRLADMMGGSISVESEYGKGSVFTVRFPQRIISAVPIGDFRARFEMSFEELESSESVFRAPKARLLIVDDTRMNLLVAAGLLRDTGINPDTALSGAEALEMTKTEQYDLILLDQRMPVMDGTETLHRLREQTEGLNANTPVICLTADALTGARDKYLAEGFDDYLSKPIDSREMKKVIMKYLPPEKILPDGEEISEDTADSGDSGGLYAALRRAGIDAGKGLSYCENDRELYLVMLAEYVQGAEEKLNSLNEFYRDRDAKNYGIFVHSLKSISRTIGAEDIADTSAALEKAADEGRWDVIESSHEGLTERYGALVKAISEAAGTDVLTAELAGEEDDEIIEFFPEEKDG